MSMLAELDGHQSIPKNWTTPNARTVPRVKRPLRKYTLFTMGVLWESEVRFWPVAPVGSGMRGARKTARGRRRPKAHVTIYG